MHLNLDGPSVCLPKDARTGLDGEALVLAFFPFLFSESWWQ